MQVGGFISSDWTSRVYTFSLQLFCCDGIMRIMHVYIYILRRIVFIFYKKKCLEKELLRIFFPNLLALLLFQIRSWRIR